MRPARRPPICRSKKTRGLCCSGSTVFAFSSNEKSCDAERGAARAAISPRGALPGSASRHVPGRGGRIAPRDVVVIVPIGMADLATYLTTSIEAQRPGVEEFAEGLSADERTALVDQLAARAQRGECAASLLRALLRLGPTRLPAARRAVRLVQDGDLRGRSALFCLSELRIAMLCQWHCGDGSNGGTAAAWAAFAIDSDARAPLFT